MPITPPESGIRSPFRLRLGIDFDTWRGVNKEADPGAILDSQLQSAINVRILPNGAIVNRGGQAKLGGPLDSCITGIFDDEVRPISQRWYFGYDQTHIEYLSPADDSTLVVTDPSATNVWLCATTFNGAILALVGQFGSGATQLRQYNPTLGQTSLVHDFGITGGQCYGMAAVGNLLYIPVWDQAGTGHLIMYTWDGANLVQDHDFGVVTHPAMAMAYNNEAYIAFYNGVYGLGATNQVWRRLAGTWTSLAMPAVTVFNCQDWAVFTDGNLYLAGVSKSGMTTDAVILKYDGTTLTLVRTLNTGGGSTNYAVTSLTVLGGLLCYAWCDSNGAGNGWSVVGTFDGTTWTDAAKDLFAQFGGHIFPNHTVLAFVQNGFLYCVAFLGNAFSFFKSPQNAITGAWTKLSAASQPSGTQCKAYL